MNKPPNTETINEEIKPIQVQGKQITIMTAELDETGEGQYKLKITASSNNVTTHKVDASSIVITSKNKELLDKLVEPFKKTFRNENPHKIGLIKQDPDGTKHFDNSMRIDCIFGHELRNYNFKTQQKGRAEQKIIDTFYKNQKPPDVFTKKEIAEKMLKKGYIGNSWYLYQEVNDVKKQLKTKEVKNFFK